MYIDVPYTVDIRKGIMPTEMKQPLYFAEENAHRITVTLVDGQDDVNLSDSVQCKVSIVIRNTNQTIGDIYGTIEENDEGHRNKCSVVLPKEAYAVFGPVNIVMNIVEPIDVVDNETVYSVTTILSLNCNVRSTVTGSVIVIDGSVIPGLDELATRITTMEGRVNDVMSDLSTETDITYLFDWENGTLYDNTGENKTNATRIRTIGKMFVPYGSSLRFACKASTHVNVYYYTRTWSGFLYYVDTFQGHVDWQNDGYVFTPAQDVYVRIIVKDDNQTSSLSTDWASRVAIYRSMTIFGKATISDERKKIFYDNKYVGKSLIKFAPISKTQDGITFAVQEDGSIIVTGTPTNTSHRVVYPIYVDAFEKLTEYGLKPNVEYVLCGAPKGGRTGGAQANQYTHALSLQNSGTPNISDFGDGVTFTINELDSTYRFVIDVRGNGVTFNHHFYPMLVEKAYYDIDNKYEKYIPNNQELERKINDIHPTVPILDGQHLIIHRGGRFGSPFNTIPAFKLCYEKGFSILEADVEVTSDNIPVIIHGNDIKPWATDLEGNTLESSVYVTGSTYQDLYDGYDFGRKFIEGGTTYTYPLSAPETHINTLKEFLMFCKRRNIVAYVDMDSTVNLNGNSNLDSAKAGYIYNVVKNTGMLNNVIFDCNTVAVAELFASMDPNLNILVQIKTAIDQSHIDDIYALRGSCSFKRLFANCSNSLYSSSVWTEEIVDYIHSKGMLAKATIKNCTAAQAKAVFDIGTDFLVCDDLVPSDVKL